MYSAHTKACTLCCSSFKQKKKVTCPQCNRITCSACTSAEPITLPPQFGIPQPVYTCQVCEKIVRNCFEVNCFTKFEPKFKTYLAAESTLSVPAKHLTHVHQQLHKKVQRILKNSSNMRFLLTVFVDMLLFEPSTPLAKKKLFHVITKSRGTKATSETVQVFRSGAATEVPSAWNSRQTLMDVEPDALLNFSFYTKKKKHVGTVSLSALFLLVFQQGTLSYSTSLT